MIIWSAPAFAAILLAALLAAAELPTINLEDALRVALLVCEQEPEHAERAAGERRAP